MSEISCRVSSSIISYVEKTRPELVMKLIKDLPYDYAFLMNTDNWIPWDSERLLEERIADLYDDSSIMFDVGQSIVSYRSLGLVNIIFNLFIRPENLYRYTPKVTKYFTRGLTEVKILESSSQSALVQITAKGKQTRGACLYNQGMFSIVPRFFGLEPAKVTEHQCVIPRSEVSAFEGNNYRVEGNNVLEAGNGSNDFKDIGEIPENGEFKLKSVTFGAPSCIFRVSWEPKKSFWAMREGSKKKALEDALREVELNYDKLQTAYSALWKSESKYRDIMENASDTICFLDTDGNITSVNKKGLDLIGYATSDMIGKHVSFMLDKTSKPLAIKAMTRCLKGNTGNIEVVAITKESDRLFLSINFNHIVEDNVHCGFMLIARDVTGEKEIAARLLEAEKFAAKGMIAAEIAHEINNSLANIETALFIVNNLTVDEEYRDHNFQSMNDEIERMSSIVKGILEVYKEDDTNMQAVDLNEEVDKVINLTSRRLRGKGISIKSNLHKGPLNITCYPGHIKQILMNLIKNSEESFNSKNAKMISVSTAMANETLKIRIHDTGNGISKADLSKVTSKLFTTKKTGIGLGLSVCTQLIERYKGRLQIQSTEGEGTTVSVLFPIDGHE